MFRSAQEGLVGVSRSPWSFFIVFSISNTLLSYGTLGFEEKLWVGFLGVAVPLGIGARLSFLDSDKPKPVIFEETFPGLPLKAWMLIFLLALCLRLYPLLNSQ